MWFWYVVVAILWAFFRWAQAETRHRRGPNWVSQRQRAKIFRQAVERVARVTNDAATARRLLISERNNHPDKSVQWCAEKVIRDFYRDRNAL